MSLARNFFYSLLFLTIVCFLVWTYSSIITISTVSGAWSDDNLHFGWVMWFLSSDEFGWKNMRSITKFKSFWFSKYLVRIWLVDLDKHKSIESTILLKRSQWMEWYGKKGSQLLSLMLKSPVITKILLIFASVSQTSFSLYLHNQWTDFYKLSYAGKPQMRAIRTYVGCTKATTNDWDIRPSVAVKASSANISWTAELIHMIELALESSHQMVPMIYNVSQSNKYW